MAVFKVKITSPDGAEVSEIIATADTDWEAEEAALMTEEPGWSVVSTEKTED